MFKFITLLLFVTPLISMVDPMQPLDYKVQSKKSKDSKDKPYDPVDSIALQGIILSNQEKIAIIDQKTFKVGDVYQQFSIKDISLDAVAFEDQDSKKIYKKTIGYPLTKTSSTLR